MAKRTIRKNPVDTTAPARHRRTADQNGNTGDTPAATPKTRTTRSRKPAAEDRGPGDTLIAGEQDAFASTPDTMSEALAELADVSHDHIAVRAYHLYLERGGHGGDEFQDWITAERQLRKWAAGGRAQ